MNCENRYVLIKGFGKAIGGKSVEPNKAVKKMLNQIGRSADAEVFTMLKNLFGRYNAQYPGEQVGFLKYLCGGLTITYDAMIVRKAMCRELKGGVSDILLIARSGFVTPVAPKWLDVEISKYIPDIAKECGVDAVTALKYYLFKVQPYITMVDESEIPHLTEILKSIKDPKDAPYVAVHFEHKTLGIATYDKKLIAYVGEQQCYKIEDIAEINVMFRKEYIAIGFSVLNIAVFFGVIAGVYQVVKKLWKYVLGTIAIAGVVLLLMRQIRRDVYDCIVDNIGEMFGDAKKSAYQVWVAVRPFVTEYLKECIRRSRSLDNKMTELSKGGRGTSSVEGNTLTYADVIRMLMLAINNKPIREKDICALFGELGYSVKGKRLLIRRVLKESGLFNRLKDGRYNLIPPVVKGSQIVVAG